MIRDWPCFYVIGAHVLSLLLLAREPDNARLALSCYLILIAAAVLAVLRDQLVPPRIRRTPCRSSERQPESN